MGSKESGQFTGRAGRGVFALLSLVLTLGTGTPAGAQDAEEADGSADIRSAPFVENGTYHDEIVTGEVVWYSVQYTDKSRLSIKAQLDGVDVDSSDHLVLYRMFLAPNLDTSIYQAEDIGGYESGPSYDNEPETDVWFIGFYLETTEQLGVVYDLEFELSGFAAASQDECGSDCTLDEDLEDLEAQAADLEGQVEECGEECLERADPEALEAARDQAESDIEAERAAVIDLCGGEEECGPSSSTPWLLVFVLFIAAAVVVGGLVRTLMQKRAAVAPSSGGDPGSPTPDTPTSSSPAPGSPNPDPSAPGHPAPEAPA